jgi:dihydrofolate synthase / folylpolyglutamate synthase
MEYQEALNYLGSFIDYEKIPFFDYSQSLKLERMSCLAERLGKPHLNLRCVHIAGTKGKGSTSAMVASILEKAGFKVGLYTSPHLVSFRERIKINDELIEPQELCALVNRIRPIIDSISKGNGNYPTFFEAYTALAFLYFKEKKVDFCVLEVGLGGRLDATNIIEKPLCCGITQISLEHTDRLGDTLREIAGEKAGIIKEGSICVSSGQETSAREVIINTCKKKNNRLLEVGKDIVFKKEGNQVFSVKGACQEYPSLEVGLLGDHQFMNAATAIGLVESLRFYDIIVDALAIRKGLKNVKWPGRLQVLKTSPYIVLDGAQNRASAMALREAVQKYFNYEKLILVLGVSKDKDIKGICEELIPFSDEVILTKASLPRAQEPSVLKGFVNKEAVIADKVCEAMVIAERIAGPSDLILVTGSFFVLGEVLNAHMVTDACGNS